MKRLHAFMSDLALIPAMWRHLATRMRRQLAWDAEKAIWEASPAHKALVAKYGEPYFFSGFGIYRALEELGFPDAKPPL